MRCLKGFLNPYFESGIILCSCPNPKRVVIKLNQLGLPFGTYWFYVFMCFVQVERFRPGAFYLSIAAGGHFEAKYHS